MSKTTHELHPAGFISADSVVDGAMLTSIERTTVLPGSAAALPPDTQSGSEIQIDTGEDAPAGLRAYQAMLDAMPHPAWIADAEGDIRIVNTRLVALVDTSAGELLGTGWLQSLHPEDSASAAVQWRASIGSGLSFLARARLRLGDGSYRWHSASAKRFLLPDRRAAWLGTLTDIHEQVRADEARLASQRRFEATLVHAPVGVAYTSVSGLFTYANAEFCRLLGYTEGELRRLTWQAITHPDDLEADLELGQAVLEGRRPFYLMNKRYVRKDGQPLHVRLFGNFIRDTDGRLLEGLAVVLDLSDMRRAELRQVEEGRRRDEFLTMLAHELRNPLAPIRNSAAALARRPGSEQVAARSAEIIERQTAHLAALLDSLLDVARITRGRFMLDRQPCDLSEIVGNVVRDHQGEADARGLVLRHRPAMKAMPIQADPIRVAQAVGNVLVNALRFTTKGSVTVACELDSENVAVCRIVDTGCGMDDRTQARLFEPFAQAEQGIDRAMGGLGVGLMIVKAIVELHGGSVRGFSRGPGQGATFETHWPLTKLA